MGPFVVDLGNSRLKWGRVTLDGRLGETGVLPLDDPEAWEAWASTWDVWDQAANWSISSVNPPAAERFARFLAGHGIVEDAGPMGLVWRMSDDQSPSRMTPGDGASGSAQGIVGVRWPDRVKWYRSAAEVPIRHDLEHPEMAGADRALAVVGALASRPGPGLVVSCGTAITVERISVAGVWQGGAIGPGLGPMAKALNVTTAQLPDVDLRDDIPDSFGRSTRPAIEAGVFWGVIGLIRELVTRQAAGVTPLPWLTWTGGDASRFAPYVDWPGSVVAPNLVLEGLIHAAPRAEP